jgi:hypothetical protein
MINLQCFNIRRCLDFVDLITLWEAKIIILLSSINCNWILLSLILAGESLNLSLILCSSSCYCSPYCMFLIRLIFSLWYWLCNLPILYNSWRTYYCLISGRTTGPKLLSGIIFEFRFIIADYWVDGDVDWLWCDYGILLLT